MRQVEDPRAVMADFAREVIAGSKEPQDQFPKEIWAAMGSHGLLDTNRIAGIPKHRCRTLTRTARALAEHGEDLGLTLSWMIHHLTSGVLAGYGQARDGCKALADGLSTGAATLSLAVSEPERGGHPKFLTTRADRDAEGWVISGEKSYLTNGPMASAFLVVAVTGESGGKKAFTTFLVDRNTPGLTVLPAMEIAFFTSAPHGGVKLDGCRVGPEAVVGAEGRAYPDLVLPFRQMEDALMTGAVTGAMTSLLAGAAAGLPKARKEADSCLEALGALAAATHTAGVLSDHIAALVDLKQPGHEEIHLFFRDLAPRFLRDLAAFADRENFSLPRPELLRDLKASGKLGKAVSRIRTRKLGKRLAHASALPPRERKW